MSKLAKAISTFLLLLMVAAVSGCASAPQVTTKPYMSGRILLLPPRDVVQNGVPHARGVGSGQTFEKFLRTRLEEAGYEVVTTDSAEFSATAVAGREQGIDEAKRKNAKYFLQSALGEFQDAAPMTFRPDYVYLDRAVMYDANTGEAVWQLAAPLYFQKGNIGSYEGLLDQHARAIATSIKANQK